MSKWHNKGFNGGKNKPPKGSDKPRKGGGIFGTGNKGNKPKPNKPNKKKVDNKKNIETVEPMVMNSKAKHITNDTSTKETRVEASFPHFRYYCKSGHPTCVVGESLKNNPDDDEYKYRKVMHGDHDGRHLNEEIKPNPDPSDPNPMFIAHRVRHDKKDNFNAKPLPWKYPTDSDTPPTDPKK